MYELKKKIGKVLTSKSVGTGPSSYKKLIYWAAVSQRLRNTAIEGTPGVEVLLSVTELVKGAFGMVETSGYQHFRVCGPTPAANMVRNGVLIFVGLLSVGLLSVPVVSENP